VNKYGVIDGVLEGDVYKIKNLVEKPRVEEAPSNLAIIGRYILTPEIFRMLENQKAGAGGEIQLTDALRELLRKQPIYGYRIRGTRYDAGDKVGFLKATVDLALRNTEVSEPFKEYILRIAKRIGSADSPSTAGEAAFPLKVQD
jgi:UTP--glucose-1-phosphate uridylyltransferase